MPKLSSIKVFGCELYSFLEKYDSGKQDEKAKGVPENRETYIVGIKDNSSSQMITTRNVRLKEDEFYVGPKESNGT